MAEETKQCTSCGRRFTDDALFCPKDGSALVPASAVKGKDAFVGREILGHIEVRSLIGAGAMGRVYRAHQRGIDRDVAVKILHKELAQNPDLVARFLREAKVASRLNHPNVVQVLLAGQLEDQTMYLVMEYLDGISLHSALLASGGSLPIARALHVALQVCDAVGEAHGVGVVHRDVKPENVMLVKRGDDPDFAKVLDFGIAHLTQKESGIETQAGLVFGTARYLSPEGARGEPVGPTTDVYAIATVVYQMLAGRTPFEHDSSVSLLVAQIHDVAPMLRSFPRAAYVPKAIEDAIMKNLAKDPTARDADGHTFGRALLEAAVSSGFNTDDLLFRPAVARAKRSMNPPAVAAPNSDKTREQAYGIKGSETPSSPIGSSSTSDPPLSDPRLPTPEPRPAVYNPSYSGKPMLAGQVGQQAGDKRRIARTVDDEAFDDIETKSPHLPQSPHSPQSPQSPSGPAAQGPAPLGASPYGPAPYGATVGMPLSPLASPVPAAPTPFPSPGLTTAIAPSPSLSPPLSPATAISPGYSPGYSPGSPSGSAGNSPGDAAAFPRANDSILGTATSPLPDDSVRAPAGVPRRGRLPAVLLLLTILAATAIGIGGYRLGYFGQPPPPTKRAEVEDLLSRAQTALEARHWDTPPGENVVELTDQLINLAPGETRTYQIRSTAADRIIREALDAKAKKDLVGAKHLFELAAHLSPPEEGIQHEIESIEADIAKDPTLASNVTDGGVSLYVATIEVGAKDKDPDLRTLEPTTFVASVKDGPGEGAADPKNPDTKAHFVVTGVGIDKPITVAAKPENAARYTATYSFKLQGGYKIVFLGRPDDFPVKAEIDVKVLPYKPGPTIAPTGWPSVPTKPSGTNTVKPPSTTGTIILTPDPTVPISPFPTGGPPPLPFPTK